jgi:hypothetical protein
VAAIAFVAAGCGSTIHIPSDIGRVHTLSVDAKQRLVFVGKRAADSIEPRKRVLCTEPMPDALVAKAAVIAAGGNFQQPGGPTVAAQLAAGQSESAGAIGYNDHTIQMLRDGYYRLCEAYMNGAIDKYQYSAMIRNADTFMVVISALQVLGSNQPRSPVALTGGPVNASINKDGTGAAGGNSKESAVVDGKLALAAATAADANGTNNPAAPSGAAEAAKANAGVAYNIVRSYLWYRQWLAHFEARLAAKQRRAKLRDKLRLERERARLWGQRWRYEKAQRQ